MKVLFKASFVGEKPPYLAERGLPDYFRLEKINYDPVPVLSADLLKDVLERFPFVPRLPNHHEALDHNYAQLKFLSGKNFLSRMKRMEEDYFRIKKTNAGENAVAWIVLQNEFLREIKIEMETLKIIEAERLKSDLHFKEVFSHRKQMTKKHMELHLKSLDEAATWFDRKLEKLEEEQKRHGRLLSPTSIALTATEVSFQNSGKLSLSTFLSSFPTAEASKLNSILLKSHKALLQGVDRFQPTEESLARKRESFFERGVFDRPVLDHSFWSQMSAGVESQKERIAENSAFGTKSLTSDSHSMDQKTKGNFDSSGRASEFRMDLKTVPSVLALMTRKPKLSSYGHPLASDEMGYSQLGALEPGKAKSSVAEHNLVVSLGRFGRDLAPISSAFEGSFYSPMQGSESIGNNSQSLEPIALKAQDLSGRVRTESKGKDPKSIPPDDASSLKASESDLLVQASRHASLKNSDALEVRPIDYSIPDSLVAFASKWSYLSPSPFAPFQVPGRHTGFSSGPVLDSLDSEKIGIQGNASDGDSLHRTQSMTSSEDQVYSKRLLNYGESPDSKVLSDRRASLQVSPVTESPSGLPSEAASGSSRDSHPYQSPSELGSSAFVKEPLLLRFDRAKEPSLEVDSDEEASFTYVPVRGSGVEEYRRSRAGDVETKVSEKRNLEQKELENEELNKTNLEPLDSKTQGKEFEENLPRKKLGI